MGDLLKQETRLIKKALAVTEDLYIGFGFVDQVRFGAKRQYKAVNASVLQGNIVVATYDELLKIDPLHLGELKVAFVISEGLHYGWDANTQSWIILSKQVTTLNSIDQLNPDPQGNTHMIVTDPVRGGIFFYDEARKTENNGGTVINGWVRFYDGYADVKWFGALGNGQTDDSDKIQNALNSVDLLYFSPGTYKISKTLSVGKNKYITADKASILSSDNISYLNLAGFNYVKGLSFKGQRGLGNQKALTIDGGEFGTNTSNILVEECSFDSIGLTAVDCNNLNDGKVIISKCAFNSCVGGAALSSTTNNVYLLDCDFSTCNKGFTSYSNNFKLLNCSFKDCTNGAQFNSTNLDTAQALIEGCNFSNAPVSFSAVETKLNFVNCSFNTDINFLNSSNLLFNNCSFIRGKITFANSNNNIFTGCDLADIYEIENDSSSSQTVNYWVDTRTTKTTTKIDGGYLKVTATQNYSSVNTSLNYIPFQTISQSMPFHPNFQKFQWFDSSTGIFDFTQSKTPGKEDLIYASVNLTVNINNVTALDWVTFFFYDITDGVPTYNSMDMSKMYGMFVNSRAAFSSNTVYNFSGYLPRRKFKLFVHNRGTQAFQIHYGGQTVETNCKTAYIAEFFGL